MFAYSPSPTSSSDLRPCHREGNGGIYRTIQHQFQPNEGGDRSKQTDLELRRKGRNLQKNLKKKHDGSRCGLKKKNDVFRCVITENPTYSQEIPSKKNDDWELKHAVVKIMALVVFHAKVSSFSNIYLPSDKPVDSVDSYGSHSPFIIHWKIICLSSKNGE